MSNVLQLKADVFDILRAQQTLQAEIQSLETKKNEKLKLLTDAENDVKDPKVSK